MIRGLVTAALLAAIVSTAAYGADARSSFGDGQSAQGLGDFELAIEKYKEALSLNPSYLEPMVGLAESFLMLEEYDEALKFVTQARGLDRANPDLAVLEGRIRIGLGDTAAARGLFNGVLARQPNHLEARLGLAEADIADGNPRNAQDLYLQTLKLDPESTRALLSLAMLSDETGDAAAAGRYYELALRSHSSDPAVQIAAAGWSERTGDFTTAEKRARLALSLAPASEPARLLLADIYLRMDRYADASTVLRDVISGNRSNELAWYLLGMSYRKAGNPAQALSSFATALQQRPDDEVARIAQDATAVASLPMDDPQRTKAAAYHLTQGQSQESRSYLERALAEYRRALILTPTSRDARVDYARIYRLFGFPDKYLSELQVLSKLGVQDTFVQDEIESLTSALSLNVSRAWGYDQYNLERQRYSIPVYSMVARNRLIHSLSSDDLAAYFGSLLGRYDTINVPQDQTTVGAFDEAFRAARAAGDDYFVLLQVDEADRSFSATAEVYLARTGGLVASYAAFRTGNDRLRDAFLRLAEQISAMLPVRGSLLARKFNQGLIDQGTFQGLKNGDKLVIVRQGGLRLQPDAPGLAYDAKDVVADFQVTNPDEGVSEGTIAIRGYFDYVNVGDQVVFQVQKAARPVVTPAQRSGNILTRLLRIGG